MVAKVLLVDDDAVSCTALRSFLEESGFEVRAVQDGPAAIETVRTFVPDVLLSDWRLRGEGDARSVARRIHALCPDVEIIFLTGFSAEEVRAQTVDVPVRSILAKPATFPAVQQAIEDVLAGSKG